MSLTIFTAVKPFYGHIGRIQRQAIVSWTRITPRPEIVLFGKVDGAAQFANEIGVHHEELLVRNQFDSPRLDWIVQRVEGLSSSKFLSLVAADTILSSNFARTVELVASQFANFLIVTRPYSMSPSQAIEWQMAQTSIDHSITEERFCRSLLPCNRSSVFAYRRGGLGIPAPLTLGDPHWNNWLVCAALIKDVPVIDATNFTRTFNQRHDYRQSKWGSLERRNNSPEAAQNASMAPECLIGEFISEVSHQIENSGNMSKNVNQNTRLIATSAEIQRRVGLPRRANKLRDDGMSLDREGYSSRALKLMDQAYALDPNTPGLNLFRSICLYNLRQYDKAEILAAQMLQDPQFSEQATLFLEVISDAKKGLRPEDQPTAPRS